jgi:hypothetical protein
MKTNIKIYVTTLITNMKGGSNCDSDTKWKRQSDGLKTIETSVHFCQRGAKK